MHCKRIFFILSMAFISCSVAMDRPTHQLIVEKANELLTNNVAKLQAYIDLENLGYYSSRLNYACGVLKHLFSIYKDKQIRCLYGDSAYYLASRVVRRADDREKLMKALDCYNFEKASKILKENPDVINAYTNCLYAGKVNPLAESVIKDDKAAIKFLLAQKNICRRSCGKTSIFSLAKSKCVLKVLLNQEEIYLESKEQPFLLTQMITVKPFVDSFERADYALRHRRAICISFESLDDILYAAIKDDYNLSFVKFLLYHQANIFHKTQYGKSPLQIITKKNNNKEIFELLRKYNIYYIPFSHCNIIEWLIDCDKLKSNLKTEENRALLLNLFAQLFTILKSHNPLIKSTYPSVQMLPTGWCFNNASFDDLKKMASKKAIRYIDSLITDICTLAFNYLWFFNTKAFNALAENYNFILQYSPQETFKICDHFLQQDEEMFLWLMERDLNFTGTNNHSDTLLHQAFKYQKRHTFKCLVQENDFIVKKNNEGKTVIDLIAEKNDKDYAALFLHSCLARYKGSNKFWSRVELGIDYSFEDFLYRKEVRKILKNVNLSLFDRTEKGLYQPLLHTLVKNDLLDLVKIVLKRGVKVNEIDGEGRSALWYAVALLDPRNMMMLLLNYGGSIDCDVIDNCKDIDMTQFLWRLMPMNLLD